jgi:hypothetical protein
MKIAGNGIQKYNYILIGYGRNGKEGFDNWKGSKKFHMISEEITIEKECNQLCRFSCPHSNHINYG